MPDNSEPNLHELSVKIDEVNQTLSVKIDEVNQALSRLQGATDAKPQYINKDDFLLHEYDSLKSEVVQRLVTRYTIISTAVVAFGAVFAIQNAYLALLYPLLAFALLLVFISNANAIHKINEYIQCYIENQVAEGSAQQPVNVIYAKLPDKKIGWQTFQVDKNQTNIHKIGFSTSRMTFPISSTVATIEGAILVFTTSDGTLNRMIFNVVMAVLSLLITALTWRIAFIEQELMSFIQDTDVADAPDITKVRRLVILAITGYKNKSVSS